LAFSPWLPRTLSLFEAMFSPPRRDRLSVSKFDLPLPDLDDYQVLESSIPWLERA
jgi:hypothetical protein